MQAFGVKCMSRPLQVSVVGGSVASIAFRVFEELASAPLPDALQACPACPGCLDFLAAADWHLPSAGIGIFIGLFLGPLIDTLYLLRV